METVQMPILKVIEYTGMTVKIMIPQKTGKIRD
jgi:hypothetical protein